MDFDFWVRIIQHFQIGYLDEYLAAARLYPEAKSSSRQMQYFDELLRILENYLKRNPDKSPRFSNKARSLVYINGARSRIGVGSFRDVKKFYILAVKTILFLYLT